MWGLGIRRGGEGRGGEEEGQMVGEGRGRALPSEQLQETHLVYFCLHLWLQCIVIAIQNDANVLSCHTTCGAWMMAL